MLVYFEIPLKERSVIITTFLEECDINQNNKKGYFRNLSCSIRLQVMHDYNMCTGIAP